ncbi:hypothetical protein V5799_005683 [Amblyomma americanum]|uniref:Monocarboxylate transporter n=1 Tax=Amblyomma americanum TaxID=6943 RepID=A0AAQ4DYJ6_AMBAM
MSGLKYVGWSAAGLVGPVTLAFLVDRFGLKRTFIILGAAVTNISPLALLLKTPEAAGCDCFRRLFFPRSGAVNINSRLLAGGPQPKYTESRETHEAQITICSVGTALQVCTQGPETTYTTSTSVEVELRGNPQCSTRSQQAAPKNGGGSSLHSRQNLENDPPNLVPTDEISSQLPEASALGCSPENSTTSSPCSLRTLFRARAFYVLLATYVVLDYTTFAVRATFVAYAMDKGLTRVVSESLIMYDAIGGLLGRLVLPLLCDLFRVARGAAVAFSLATLSACLAALTFFTSHPAVASIVVAASLPTGFLLAMKPVLIGDYLGVKMFAATWGLTGTCTVPLLLVNPVITGATSIFFRVASTGQSKTGALDIEGGSEKLREKGTYLSRGIQNGCLTQLKLSNVEKN